MSKKKRFILLETVYISANLSASLHNRTELVELQNVEKQIQRKYRLEIRCLYIEINLGLISKILNDKSTRFLYKK